MMWKVGFFCLIASLLFACVEELDGPNTLAPKDPPQYGTLVIYTDWVDMDLHCQDFDVTLDGSYVGTLSQRVSTAFCYDNFAITLASVSAGVHNIYAGPCDSVSWSLQPTIFPDQCNVIILSR